MGKIKKICFIASGYPVPGDMVNTFVDALICEMSRQGIEATVIAPFDIIGYVAGKVKKRKHHFIKETETGEIIDIYCPKYVGVVGVSGLTKISQKAYNHAVLREFKKLKKKKDFDAVYGHFFNVGGLPAWLVGKKYGIPSFVACGESSLKKLYKYQNEDIFVDCVKNIDGIICVSTKNKTELNDMWVKGFSIDKKTVVLPNAYNPDEFYPMDKEKARKDLNIAQDDFVVCFTGRFKEHKGIGVLNEALKNCPGVRSIFIGSGPVKPDCDGIIHMGPVDHGDIAKYLCASDVFVLPTKAEGCCNAIVEALGCGLPVISSNLPFNYDILDESNSIMVNPDSPEEVSNAIMKLKNDKVFSEKLRDGTMYSREGLTISKRAEKIIEFMNKITDGE